MVRTPSCDKSGMRKGTWTPKEDMKLIAYVTRYGCSNWCQLPKLYNFDLYIYIYIYIYIYCNTSQNYNEAIKL